MIDLDALRRAFDASFAEPPPASRAAAQRYLVVRAGTRTLALRLGDALAVVAAPALARVPRAHPALLGVGAARGRATAVFSLAALLGLQAGSERRPCRWLALLDDRVAIAVDELAGVVDAERELAVPQTDQRSFTTHAIAAAAGTLDVIDAPALLRSLRPATAGGNG